LWLLGLGGGQFGMAIEILRNILGEMMLSNKIT
jgi:hypothetical protein